MHTKPVKELQKVIEEKKQELFGLRLKLATGQLAQTASLKNVKKDIARLFTILKQKEENKDATKHSKG